MDHRKRNTPSLRQGQRRKVSYIKSCVTSYDAFCYYAQMYGWDPMNPKKPFSDPAIRPHKQKTPSCYVVKKDGEYFFKEFASNAGGDFISFVQHIYHLGFSEALEMISKDFNLDL